jgi:uncharacterized protein
MLEYIQNNILGKDEKFTDHFDMIAGTSTGGMIALGLLKNSSIDKMRELYYQMSEVVFKGGLSNISTGLSKLFKTNGWYSTEKLEESFKKFYGDDKISDYTSSNCKVFVTTGN